MADIPSAKRWLPLEANPDVMNQFLWGLGLPEEEAECYDVYGLDDELLEMVPRSVLAVLFLYPLTAESEAERLKENNNDKVKIRVVNLPDGILTDEITKIRVIYQLLSPGIVAKVCNLVSHDIALTGNIEENNFFNLRKQQKDV